MKTLKIIFLFAFFAANAQQSPVHCDKPLMASVKANFENDLKHRNLSLYILGGIVSAIKENDLEFAEKYDVAYHDFGCMAPADFKYYECYNRLVFGYLDQKYGESWQSEISPNTLGFLKWKNRMNK